MWTTPILAVLALAEPAAAPAPAPAPTTAPTTAPAPQPYPGAPNYQPPPPGYQPPPPGYAPYGYPPPGYGYPPPQPYQPPPPKKKGPRGKGMMIAGWSIFGGTWLLGIISGASFMDQNTPSGYLYGRRLMTPVIGPFMAAGISGGDAFSSMGFVFLGLAQTTGLALGIAGTVLFARDRKAQRDVTAGLHLGRGVYLRSSPRWGGATLSLNLRF